MHEAIIAGIRDRVARCRRLAGETADERSRWILIEMANEGEAAIQALEAAPQMPGPIPEA